MSDVPGLEPSDPVGEQLRSVARAILARAHTTIEDRDRIQAITVHEFRTEMKRWRAFLRLMEPFLEAPDRVWRRDAGVFARALANARDVQAALDALEDLEPHAASHRLSSSSWATMRARLEALRTEAESESLTPGLRLRIAAGLDRAASRLEHWPLDRLRFHHVAVELSRGYGRARQAIPADWRSATLDELHRLRQLVIVHRYQMEVIEPLWPGLTKSWIRQLQKLRTRLGQCQDLSVLQRLAEPHEALARWRSPLGTESAQRQAQHIDAVARYAARLFAERPSDFRRRLKRLWRGLAAR